MVNQLTSGRLEWPVIPPTGGLGRHLAALSVKAALSVEDDVSSSAFWSTPGRARAHGHGRPTKRSAETLSLMPWATAAVLSRIAPWKVPYQQ